MAKTVQTRVSGAWRNVKAVSVKVAGTWRNVSQAYVKVGGVWKELLNLFPAWNLSTVSFDSKTLTVSGQTENARAMSFKTDGTRFFLTELSAGDAVTRIFQYSLSVPWDISTGSYVKQVSLYLSNFTFDSIAFKDDGTKLIVSAYSSSVTRLLQYSLSTPWDIATASLDKTKDLPSRANSIYITSGGDVLYFNTATVIHETVMSTPWDIATLTVTGKSYDVGNSASYGLSFSPSGETIFMQNSDILSESKIYEYSLSTPWDIDTISYTGVFFSTNVKYFGDLYVNPEATKLYCCGVSTGNIPQYSMNA